MKKIFIAAVAVLALAACQRNEIIEAEEAPAKQHLTLNLNINKSADTKAIKAGWEVGDIILAVFDHDISSGYNHLALTYNGTTWDAVWTPGLEDALIAKGTGVVSALFVPNAVSYVNDSADGYSVMYKPQDSKGDDIYSYSLKADNAAYTISGTTLSATLNMVLNNNDGPFVHFFIDGISGTNYTLSAENNEIWTVRFGRFYKDGRVLSSDYEFIVPGYPIGSGVEFSALPDKVTPAEVHYVFTLTNTETGDSYQYDAGNHTLYGGESIVLPAFSNWTPLP